MWWPLLCRNKAGPFTKASFTGFAGWCWVSLCRNTASCDTVLRRCVPQHLVIFSIQYCSIRFWNTNFQTDIGYFWVKKISDSQICTKISDGGNSLNLSGVMKGSFTILKQIFLLILAEKQHFKTKIYTFCCRNQRFPKFRLKLLMVVAKGNF